MKFHANGFQQRARFFLLEVEIGIARDAEGDAGQHLVAAVHAAEILRNQVLKEEVIKGAVGSGQANEPGQGARHRHHSQHQGTGAAPLAPQQQCQAKGLVQHPRKRVGRVDGDGGQQRIDLALKITLGKGLGLFTQFFPLQQADTLFAQFGEQMLVPAAILGIDKGVDFSGEHGQRLIGTEAVVSLLAVAVFNALQQPGLANLNILVQVVARDGQEFDPFQQGICRVFGFFEDTPVELHPGVVPAVEELLFLRSACHRIRPIRRVGKSTAFPPGPKPNTPATEENRPHAIHTE